MTYYNDGSVLIRDRIEADTAYFSEAERAQGWNDTEDKHSARMADHKAGICIALVAEYNGVPAGYVNLYFKVSDGPFVDKGLPVVVDFNVLEKFRRRGIGRRLMDMTEALAAERSDEICLSVGLYDGYGAAQRIYVKRGYIPDGSGVWYGSQPAWAYDREYLIDDDLCLWMSKKLR